MTIPFMYLECSDLREMELGGVVSTSVQTALPWGNESAETSLTFQGVADDPRFERYEILYQVVDDVDVIVNQENVRRLLENRRFHAFYNRQQGYFLVQTNRRDARNAFVRLAAASPPLAADHHEINLLDVLQVGEPTGAHFGNLKIAKVRAAAVFGSTTVVDSEEWNHYAELGELSIVYMLASTQGGDERALQLLKDRSVVLMKHVNERQDLQFVAELQESLDEVLASPRTQNEVVP